MKRYIVLTTLAICLFSQNSQANEFSYALKLYQDKFYDLAIKEFDNFAKKYPNSGQTPDALFYLGRSYKQYGETEKALRVFQRTAIDFPNYLKADEAWLEVGGLQEKQKNYADAATSFETIKLLYSKSAFAAEALYRASAMYERANNFGKAMFTCRVIIDEYSDSPYFARASLQLVRLLRLDNKLPEAKLELSKLAANGELRSALRFEEAQIRLAEHESAVAKTILTRILADDPSFKQTADVHFQLGEIEFRGGDYAAALASFQKSLNSVNAETAQERIADCHFLSENFAEAAKFYAKSESPLAIFKRGLALEKLGKTADALTELERLNPAQVRLSGELKDQLVLSRARLMQKGNDRLAIVSFINTHLPQVSEAEVALNLSEILGLVYEQRLEFDLALGTYNRFLLANPSFWKNDKLLWRKGNLLERTGKLSEAIKVYEQLGAGFPLSEHFAENEERLRVLGANNQNSQADINRQMSQFLAELIENKSKGLLYFRLGQLNFENMNDYAAATGYFEKALAELTDAEKRVDVLFYLARSAMNLAGAQNTDSLYSRAFDYYGKALQAKPSKQMRFRASLGLIFAQLKLIRKEPDLNTRAIKYYEKLIDENQTNSELYKAQLLLVEFYKKEGRFADALQTLVSVQKSKASELVSLELAELYTRQDSLLRAADLYRESLMAYPQSKRRYSTIRQLSEIEEKLGRKENSVLFLKMLVDNYPQIEHTAEKSEIIRYFLDKKDIATAEKYLPRESATAAVGDIVLATEFDQTGHEHLLQLAHLYDAKNEHSKAIRYYQDYIRLSGNSKNDNDTYYAIGQIYVEENRFDQAVSYFERIQPNFANYAHIEQSLAVLYFETENYKKAAEFGKRVITRLDKADPSFVVVNRNYLISLIKSQGLTNFRTQLKSYQSQFPKDREGHARILYEYAMQERKNKNYTRSNKLLAEIIDDYDNTSYVDNATYMTGLNYIVVNNFEKAMEIFTEFPDDFPQSSILDQYYNSLGTILEQFGKNDDAITAYQNALQKSTSEKTKKLSYAKLISLYNKLGLSESVLSTASTFIQLYPADEKAFNIKILIGQALSNMSRGVEAVAHFKKLKLEASSESEPEIQYWIANTYYKMGSYEAAISEFIKIPLLSKKTKLQWVPSALYYAGQSYEKLGKNGDAVRMYEKIISTPGIDAVFKNDAKKRISQLKAG